MKKLTIAVAMLCLSGSGVFAAADRNWSVTAGAGFPTFASLQVARKVTDKLTIGVAAGGSMVPESTKSCGAKVKMRGKSFEVISRYHFTGTSFFGGLNAGYQDFYVQSVQDAAPAYDIKDGVKVFYVTPHIGLFKVYESGLSIGAELGVRLPLSSSSYTDHSGPGTYNSDVQDTVDKGKNIFAKHPMPYVTLFRIGYSF